MSAMAGPAWSSEPPTNWMVEREGGLKRELGWPAWVNTNAYHYIAYLLGGYYKEEEDRQKATSDCHVSNALNSPLAANALWFLYSVAIFLLFFLSPTACSRESCSKLKISEALLKCGHQGWCNQAFKKRERGRNNGGWVVVGGYIWHIFSLQVCWLKRATAEDLDLHATHGAASLSLCLATTHQNKMMSSRGICKHSW